MLSRLFEGEMTLEQKWHNFVKRVSLQEKDDFQVYFSIKIETRQGITSKDVRKIINSLGMKVLKGTEIIQSNTGVDILNSKLDSSKYYIVDELSATDIYSATITAINQLNRRISVATFYNTISPWIAYSPQIVVFSKKNNMVESLKLTDVFKTYDYVDSTNNVFEDTKNILIDSDKSHIMNRLHSAFSYTNLSRTSLFQETKYISLWIAIESVMRTRQYQDIISHIKYILPEILSVRYVYRILRNFSEDCIRCGFKNDPQLDINMESTDKKLLVEKLIAIFRDETKYSLLLNNCKENTLLSYRCSVIYSLLNDTSQIEQKFRNYTQKVRWHIQRLYRIRNEITHSAFQDAKSLTIYIEHLYTYLAQLVSEVVYYVEHKKVTSIEEALATIVENYKTFMELLKNREIANKDILTNGVIDILN
jgi:hypothetical protein